MTSRETVVSWIDRAAAGCLLLLAFASPLSIAATQTAWALGLLFCLVRIVLVRPLPKLKAIDTAILIFVGLTFISSLFSYEPAVSTRKMVTVSLVTIVYLVSRSLNSERMLRYMVILVLAGCAISTVWTFGVLAVGKNLKVTKLALDSVLRDAGIQEDDTILTINKQSISSPDDITRALSSAAGTIVPAHYYRLELTYDGSFRVPDLGTDSAAALGIVEWHRGRDTRAEGFFGHYTTYSEALQLIGSLALGLIIVGGFNARYRVLLGITIVAISVSLFLTFTRASWFGFAVSSALMMLVGASRKAILICILCAVPLTGLGLFYLQQWRHVGMVDTSDGSTTWRTTVWREGFNVLVSNPRHLAVGIGMDSLKYHWQDWHMFDNGNLPLGHMHSDYLHIAFERGVPALIAWLAWMGIYLRMLWFAFRKVDMGRFDRGILLGCLGGTVGFLTAGLVHYNWGDSEVVMILYLLMGISLFIIARSSDVSPSPATS